MVRMVPDGGAVMQMTADRHEYRAIFAGDLENVAAEARREGRLHPFLDDLVTKVQRVVGDGILLGGISVCDSDLQKRTAFALRDLNVRVHARPSDDPDAADLVLVDYLVEDLPMVTNLVLLASGDHIFAEPVSDLVARGLRVVVLAVPGHVSSDLYRAATDYVPLDIAA